jgi:hypothetical protein
MTIDPVRVCGIIAPWHSWSGVVMEFRHVFVFIPCLVAGLWSAVTPGRAVTHITSADTLTISLSALPAATYTSVSAELNVFGGPDLINPGEGWRVSLFTSGNTLLSQETFSNVFGVDITSGSAADNPGPVDNTGHFFIDQIVGSFDLHQLFIRGFNAGIISGGPVEVLSFEVGTAATPLPAALPLIATGLGALGLFGWRRKKRAALAA